MTRARPAPGRPSLDGLEAKWSEQWEARGVYRFDRSKPRAGIFSVDTPPPTVSGSLHLGSAFGYVQTDAIARYRRMRGDEVFYPMGWDDNGLPTERRVQTYFGVRCDPSLPYVPDIDTTPQPGRALPVSRQNFIELCHRQTAEDEQVFEHTWRMLGLSVDWSFTYATIDDRSRSVAQMAFLRNYARGEAYAAWAPTLWDVDFKTAVAQAELEDREVAAATHFIAFPRPSGEASVEIATTRPELLPSCVALVAHPDDPRYQPLFGSEVDTPVFGVRVPILAHRLADPEKGTGIAMICTFGDVTDIVWWRELDLPLRAVMQRDGTLQTQKPDWIDEEAAEVWRELGGLTANQARARIVGLLKEAGNLAGEPSPIRHSVKFFEKGDRPLEIVTSRQWYIRNGAHDDTLQSEMLARGRELNWHPEFMRVRYEHWVEGLNSDWLISRQRIFGVPLPLWYETDDDAEPDYDSPIVPPESMLPIDPATDVPPGFTEADRGRPRGFVGEADVMDTWATSSLTPQIVCGWGADADLFERTFPMDLRPQGPEIIRTWLFATALRSHLEHGVLPWAHATINGWVLDPHRKKMSKSKGNVTTPMPLVEKFGADGFRYWACRGAPGTDTAADEDVMKVGRRLATKLLNVSNFILGLQDADAAQVTAAVDRAMLAQLRDAVRAAGEAFETFDYSRALDRVETFFWRFCDLYVELVKARAYGGGDGSGSAVAALRQALHHLQRLFAPFLPFVTEEVWSRWQDGSIHRQPWPQPEELATALDDASPPELLDAAADVLADIHKAKTAAKRSLRSPVQAVVVIDEPDRLHLLELALIDLGAAGHVERFELREGAKREVTVDLA